MAGTRKFPQTQQQADAAGAAAMLDAKAEAPLVGAFRDSDAAMSSGAAIGSKEIGDAVETLQKYKQGKSNFENRIISEERWWKLRHWEDIRRGTKDAGESPEPASAWLFNSIMNKHADAMDNYPEPVCLPREQSDEESAKTLSSVLPVIMEYNEFDSTYSFEWWEKLKHGVAIYGVFWDKARRYCHRGN